jgi:hypothetical protein
VTPDIDLGRAARQGVAVAPMELLDRGILRNFLMVVGHDGAAPAPPPGSVGCPTCGRSFLTAVFLETHRNSSISCRSTPPATVT